MIPGIESLRFICALIVVLGHLNITLPGNMPQHSLINIIWHNIFNGPAAVIVFFLISGLCIHRPQAARSLVKIEIKEFYVRRFVRIFPPVLVTILIYMNVHVNIDYPNFSVLWSILCESIYYVLYPALLMAAHRFGWAKMIVGATIGAIAYALANVPLLITGNNGYPSLGLMTWFIGLPVWLTGCWLAENLDRFPVPTLSKIWGLRLTIFWVSVGLSVVKFHLAAPWGTNVLWLNAFAFLAAGWLGYEVAYNFANTPSKLLENHGRWSFSLYLVHPIIWQMTFNFNIPWTFSNGVAALATALLCSLLFYFAVEKPSHIIARRLGHAKKNSGPRAV